MSLVRPSTPLALSTDPAPAAPSASWLPARTAPLVRVRPQRTEAALAVPEDFDPDEDTAPATRGDLARLEAVVSELLDREEGRAEILARVEAAGLSLLADLAALRHRLDGEDLAY